MEKDAVALLGEPVVESLILLKRGAVKTMRPATGGVVGFLAVAAAAKLRKDPTPVQPAPNGYAGGGYLVLTATKLVLFAVEDGRFKQSPGEVLAEFLPGQIDRFEFGKAAIGVGTLGLIGVSGDRWAFEFSTVSRKKLNRMAEATNALIVE